MRKILLAVSALVVGLTGAGVNTAATASAQGANSMYVAAASGSYKVGDSFTVSVRVNTSDPINAAGVRLGYNESLQFISIDGAGSAFGIDASSSGGNGSVSIDRGTVTAVSGDQLVAKVTFKAAVAGSGSLQVLNSSQALSASTNQDVLGARAGGTYTVAAASGPSTPPASSGGTTPTPTPTAPTPTAPAKANNSKTTIAPQGNSSATPLPGDSIVELSAPAMVETTADGGREISKVEYLLNGKAVSTDSTPPYSHAIDSTNLANGTYSLTTKTYYKDGKVETSVASLIVNNPFGAKQLWLQLKRYAWLVVLLLVVAGGLVYLRFFRGKGQNQGGYAYGQDKGQGSQTPPNTGHGTVVVGGTTAASPSILSQSVVAPGIPPSPPASPAPPVPAITTGPIDKQPPTAG